jgi:succinate dehydrogenase (ubiquinone) cytochrome b560 subunit
MLFSGVQIQSLPSSASEEILNAQRLKRPSSPHFTIYQPQLTWLSSIANRATGGALSARMSPFLMDH